LSRVIGFLPTKRDPNGLQQAADSGRPLDNPVQRAAEEATNRELKKAIADQKAKQKKSS